MSPEPSKLVCIGRTELLLAGDHPLDLHQANWPRYDRALGEIARLVWAKYPGFRAIDIGANVGDTAALLCSYNDVTTLCVEGHPGFLSLLQANAQRVGPHIEIAPCFVGPSDGRGFYKIVDHTDGTAKLVETDEASGGLEIWTKNLRTLLTDHPDYVDHRLLKIDTDGFDFPIINSSVETLRAVQPVLFYEYAPFEGVNGIAEGVQTMRSLADAGYSKMIVYDNFGHYMINLDVPDFDRFVDLNAFLCSNRVDGAAVYYLDICAFTPRDQDIYEALRRFELGRFFQL